MYEIISGMYVIRLPAVSELQCNRNISIQILSEKLQSISISRSIIRINYLKSLP